MSLRVRSTIRTALAHRTFLQGGLATWFAGEPLISYAGGKSNYPNGEFNSGNKSLVSNHPFPYCRICRAR